MKILQFNVKGKWRYILATFMCLIILGMSSVYLGALGAPSLFATGLIIFTFAFIGLAIAIILNVKHFNIIEVNKNNGK